MENRQLLKDPANKSPFLLKKLPKFADFFSDRKRVLEIGCGWGEFLEMLKARGVQAEAVELDKRRAKYSRDRGFKIYGMKGHEFLKRSPKGRFDGLFMSNVLEHMQVQEAIELFRRAHAALAPGAKLAITTMNSRCLGVMTDSFWNDLEHTRPYTLPMIAEILEDLGFRILKAATDEDTRPQGPLRWLLRFIRTRIVGPYFEAPEIYVLAEK